MVAAREPWWIQPCTACAESAIDRYQRIGGTPGPYPATVGCADGQDGLCTPHRHAVERERQRPERERQRAGREQAREARRKARWMKRWTAALPEGQE